MGNMPNLPTRQSDYDPKPKYERGKSAEYQHLYSWRWAKYSKGRLKRHPLCVICLEEGKTTPATCTDHISPHKGLRSKFWNKYNLQSLCETCHNVKTATEGAFGKWAKTWCAQTTRRTASHFGIITMLYSESLLQNLLYGIKTNLNTQGRKSTNKAIIRN